MYTPFYSTKQYNSSAAFNAAAGYVTQTLQQNMLSTMATGILSPGSATYTTSGLTLNVNFGSTFAMILGNGITAYAHGTTNGADTQSYSVSFASFVPGSGSQEVYAYLTLTQIYQNPYTVIGPPIGHPSWNPNFVPYTAYATLVDSFSLNVGTSIPGNSQEVARISLSAGATTLTGIDYSHQYIAGAQLRLPVSTQMPSSLVTTDSDGRPQFAQTGVGYQYFTNSGTFTVPSNVYEIEIEVWGGGGGGGGAPSGIAFGSGGGGGGYSWLKVATTPGVTYTVTVGNNGSGGGGGNGSAGGASSCVGAGVNVSAGGGVGGIGNSNASAGNSGSTGSGGGLNLQGQQGGAAFALTSYGVGGYGGSSPRGGFGGAQAIGANGNPGLVPGGGGGGGGSQTGFVSGGGEGAPGAVLISWG